MTVVLIKRLRGVALQKVRIFADLPTLLVIFAFTCSVLEEEVGGAIRLEGSWDGGGGGARIFLEFY